MLPTLCTLSVLAGLALASCASEAAADRVAGEAAETRPSPPEWVQAPAAGWDEQAQPLLLQVTGSAAIAAGQADVISEAEQAAQADALALLSAFLDGALSQLDTPAAPASGVVAALQSARVRGKFHDGRRFFVWMSCDAGAALGAQATPELRDALARLVAERNHR